MIINIRIELSTEQLEELRKTGELTIKVAADRVSLNEKAKDSWPDSKGHKEIEWLIREAKYYGLEPSELPQLSMRRVMELFERNIRSTRSDARWSDRQDAKTQLIESVKEVGIHLFDGEEGPETIKSILSIRNANLLKRHEGLVTITDLKTTTMGEIRAISGLGKVNFPEVEEKLKNYVKQ